MKLLHLADPSKAAVQNRHTEADSWIFQTLCTAYSYGSLLRFPLFGRSIRFDLQAAWILGQDLYYIYQQTSLSGNSSFNDLTRNQLCFTRVSENKTVFSLQSLFSSDEGEEEMKRLVVRKEPCPCKQIVIEVSLLCGLPLAKVS